MNARHPTLNISALLLLAVLFCNIATARVVGLHDWDVAEGWSDSSGLWSLDESSAYLQFDLPGGFDADDPEWGPALVETDASALWAGTWQPDMFVRFDFWAEAEPEVVRVQWGSSTNARVWTATVFNSTNDNITLEEWTTLTAPNFNSTNAWGGAGTIQDLTDDLKTIDWIGVYVARGGVGGSEDYRIDNFSLIIPEPPEIFVLATIFAMTLYYYKRKRTRLASPAL